jgi:beta-xylosidase
MGTYKNPVYKNYFADPCVWKFEGNYFAVGTGPIVNVGNEVHESDLSSAKIDGEERAIPILSSKNFVDWKSEGAALRVPKEFSGKPFWAPEVAVHDGEFYLYYSTAIADLHHQIRVAKSSTPLGPYDDIGWMICATPGCPFAIDPHPFRDDSQWYLFYAKDFLDHDSKVFAGTALVVDKLIGMTKLAGEEKVVLRARNRWQLFKAHREMYGRIFDWHTLEGPFVRKHDGLYYCFYSGGCYENETYGVDYGIAKNVMGPYDDSGNESGPRVLKTVPDRVIGPGHHSIAPGPDDKTEYIVYHAWDLERKARRMCFDKLIWTEKGPRCLGPTWTEQPI